MTSSTRLNAMPVVRLPRTALTTPRPSPAPRSTAKDGFEPARRAPMALAASIPTGRVQQAGGFDLGVVAFKGKVIAEHKNEGGYDLYVLEAEGSAKAEGSGGIVGGSAKVEAKLRYTVRVPSGSDADPTTINPFDPSTMPEGTVVTLDGSAAGSAKGTVGKDINVGQVKANVAAEIGVSGAAEVAISVEKTGPQKVRVTVGPSTSLDVTGRVGVSAEVAGVKAGAEIGGSYHQDTQRSKSVEFDLATPEGRAAYETFCATGTLPKQVGAGITDCRSVETSAYNGEYHGSIELAGYKATLFGDDWAGSMKKTSNADGTVDTEERLRKDNNDATIVIARHFNADGSEDVSRREVRYEIAVTEENQKQLEETLASAYGREVDLTPGQRVEVAMTPDDVAKLNAQIDGLRSIGLLIVFDAAAAELRDGADVEGEAPMRVPNFDPQAMEILGEATGRAPGTVTIRNADGSEPVSAQALVQQMIEQVQAQLGPTA